MHRVLFAAVLFSTACMPKIYEPTTWEHADSQVSQEADIYACMKENTSYQRRASVNNVGAQASAGDEVDPVLYRACMQARGYTVVDKDRSASADALHRYIAAAPAAKTVAIDVGLSHGGGLRNEVRTDSVDDPTGVPQYAVSNELRNDYGSMRGSVGLSYRPSRLIEVGGRVELRKVYTWSEVGQGSATDADGVYVPYLELPNQTAPYADVSARARLPMMPRLSLQAGAGAGYIPAYQAPGFQVTGRVDNDLDEAVDLNQTVTPVTRAATVRPFLRVGASYEVVMAQPHGLMLGVGLERPFAAREYMRADVSVAYRFSPSKP